MKSFSCCLYCSAELLSHKPLKWVVTRTGTYPVNVWQQSLNPWIQTNKFWSMNGCCVFCNLLFFFMHYYKVLLTHKFAHLHSNHTTERRRLALMLLASSSSSSSQQEVIELVQDTHTHTEREKEGEKIQNNYKDRHILFCCSCSHFQLQRCHGNPTIWFLLNKEVGFFGALTMASCCRHSSSQPSTAHTYAHRHIRAS